MTDRHPLHTKIKIGLDETRLMILGASILLGFHIDAPFFDNFQSFGKLFRTLSAIAFLLMIATVAGLIFPSAYHRIAEDGAESLHLLHVISVTTAVVLLPFALAIGIDVFMAVAALFQWKIGLAAGLATFLCAAWFWYGLGRVRRGTSDREAPDMTEQRHMPSLDTCIDRMLVEARVLLPGVQALLGFQLSIVLTKAFEALPDFSKAIHAVALGWTCLAMILLVAPAAYHRLACGGDSTEDLLHIGSRMVTASTVPLAFGIALDAYVVIAHLASSNTVGAAVSGSVLVLLLGLWIGFPALVRRRRLGTNRLARQG